MKTGQLEPRHLKEALNISLPWEKIQWGSFDCPSSFRCQIADTLIDRPVFLKASI